LWKGNRMTCTCGYHPFCINNYRICQVRETVAGTGRYEV
jgi:hypothetical protein